MEEIPTFLTINSEKIFSIFHVPDIKDVKGAFVFIHPFAEEKLWSHRVYVSFARELSNMGYIVVRFDFRGHGDSDGEFVDSSIENNIADISAVIREIKDKYQIEYVGLFGLRLGATLAAIYADSYNDISNLILWDPVINGERYMQELLRSNLAAQMALKGKVEVTREDLVNQMQSGTPINIEGYLLTYDYYKQISELNLLEVDYRETISCLINQIVRNPKQPINKTYSEIISKFAEDSQLIKSHEEQFWKEIKTFYQNAENLSSSTINWLQALK